MKDADYVLRKCRIRQERGAVKNAGRVVVNREFKDLAERKIRRIPRGAWSIFLTRFFVSFSFMEKDKNKIKPLDIHYRFKIHVNIFKLNNQFIK
jgi:hypothetical protein